MNVISIGGSDPSSGAGIQNDLKVFSILGAHCFTVITSITSQNTRKFSKIEPISPMMIKSQIESIFSDFSVDAIKVGMVYNSAAIKAIYSKLKGLKIPIVLDPVLKSTTGGVLIKKNALTHYKKFLIPLADVITPNVFEAEKTGLESKNYIKKGVSRRGIRFFHLESRKVSLSSIFLDFWSPRGQLVIKKLILKISKIRRKSQFWC